MPPNVFLVCQWDDLKETKLEILSDIEDLGNIEDVVQELDREESRIVIRLELRKFRKPTTMVQGLPENKKNSLKEIAHKLKRSLATGGTAKDGVIILQGDQREGVRTELIRMGYPESSIEVQ